jgi:hypothetical protein
MGGRCSQEPGSVLFGVCTPAACPPELCWVQGVRCRAGSLNHNWSAVSLLGGWHACRAVLSVLSSGRCWEQGCKNGCAPRCWTCALGGGGGVADSDRINAIAGARIFAVRESHGFGCCGQFSPGQHAHQSCLRIGSAKQEWGLKSGCTYRCPGLRFDA